MTYVPWEVIEHNTSAWIKFYEKIKDPIRLHDYHYNYLLACFLKYMPPTQGEVLFTARIGKSEHENAILTDKDDNYFIQVNIPEPDEPSTDKEYLYTFDAKTDNIIDINNKYLQKAIHQSIEKYPRTYLFEYRGMPLNTRQYTRLLKNTVATRTDNIRSAYFSSIYNIEPMPNDEELIYISRCMRTSTRTLLETYLRSTKYIETAQETFRGTKRHLDNELYIIVPVRQNNTANCTDADHA
jgi:hypothetical protein